MNATEIAREIELGNFTAEELNLLTESLKYARSKVARRNANSFTAGSTAFVTHDKLGGRVQVQVEKVKIKKADVKVMATGQRFVVPLSMLESA
jgi:hypothetical protein